jgi:hypothetical protein
MLEHTIGDVYDHKQKKEGAHLEDAKAWENCTKNQFNMDYGWN